MLSLRARPKTFHNPQLDRNFRLHAARRSHPKGLWVQVKQKLTKTVGETAGKFPLSFLVLGFDVPLPSTEVRPECRFDQVVAIGLKTLAKANCLYACTFSVLSIREVIHALVRGGRYPSTEWRSFL